MTDNKFIEEDWERVHLMDEMYLYEMQIQAEEEWQRWEDEHRKPAKIIVKMEKYEKIKTVEKGQNAD